MKFIFETFIKIAIISIKAVRLHPLDGKNDTHQIPTNQTARFSIWPIQKKHLLDPQFGTIRRSAVRLQSVRILG